MNGKGMKRIGLMSLLILSLLIFIPAGRAQAATVDGFGDESILAVKVNSARVRKQASLSADVVTVLNKDNQVKQKIAVTGSDGKTWIRVSFTKGGKKTYGYIRSDLLTLVKKPADSGSNSNTPNNSSNSQNNQQVTTQTDDILQVTATAVRVREEPSKDSAIVTNLLQGDKVKQKKVKTGADGKSWTKISVTIHGQKFHGYVRSDYLALYQKAGDAASSAANAANEDIRYVSATAVRVRESASNKSTIIANLLQGDAIDYRGTRTGDDGKQWTKVSFTINKTRYHGYIRSDYLSKTK